MDTQKYDLTMREF